MTGDVEQYYQCRTVVLEAAEVLGTQDVPQLRVRLRVIGGTTKEPDRY